MTKELVTKITKAAIDVGGKLKADKKNTEQKYDYLSADKILSICGQALFTNGVAVVPNLQEHEVTLFEYTDSYGKPKRRYDCKVKFEIIVTDGEGSFTLPWFGAGSDYSVPDKALYKAVTSGHKYFLMKLLCIGEGNEDGEHETEGESPKPEQPAAKPAQPIPQAEPEPHAKPERPYPAATVKKGLEQKAKTYEGKNASPKQRTLMVMLIAQVLQDDTKRHNVCKFLFGNGSSKTMTDAQVLAAIDWLDPQQDNGGAYSPSDIAAREVNNVYQAAIAEGQPALV